MEQVERIAIQDFDRPFETIEPARLATPLVFSSPHSGSTYPPRFLAQQGPTPEQWEQLAACEWPAWFPLPKAS